MRHVIEHAAKVWKSYIKTPKWKFIEISEIVYKSSTVPELKRAGLCE